RPRLRALGRKRPSLLGRVVLRRALLRHLDRSRRALDEPARSRARGGARRADDRRLPHRQRHRRLSVRRRQGRTAPRRPRAGTARQGRPGQGASGLPRLAAELGRLPSPALLHPVAFGPGGFDASDPDVLPPDSRYGTTGDFRTAVDAAHRLGQLVMPYLNVSWWNPQSPTVQSLPPPLTPASLAVQRSGGAPVTEQFSGHDGYVVSPFVPYVRQRVDEELERWRTDVPADCLFFDQIGARPWLRDFNPSSPTPLAYEDGWLGLMSPYADRCLMVEDGWDRLAATFVGFDGSLMLMQREFDWLDEQWGE